MPRPSDFGYFVMVLRGAEGDYPALIDISSFFYDLNLLYEFVRIIVDPKYRTFRFSRFATYRNVKRIDADDRLEVERLHVGSPFELSTILIATPVAATALWVLIQSFEKIANFPLNRQILKLQRDKLEKELQATQPGAGPATIRDDASFHEQVRTREAEYYFGRVERHLQDTPIRLTEIEITHTRELRAQDKSKR